MAILPLLSGIEVKEGKAEQCLWIGQVAIAQRFLQRLRSTQRMYPGVQEKSLILMMMRKLEALSNEYKDSFESLIDGVSDNDAESLFWFQAPGFFPQGSTNLEQRRTMLIELRPMHEL